MQAATSSFTRSIERAHPAVFNTVACVAAFIAYCCMYAFRKPYTVASYGDLSLWGVQFKIALVVAQVMGYALSKFIGIRVISSLNPAHRGWMMLGLLGLAELSLLGFAVTPFPYNIVWMFVNGLPLGMIWGVVFGYLEGRRSTELLAAALSVNFIISSGFVKSVGQWLLLQHHVAVFWMPVVAGLLFVPPLLLSIWLLEKLPAPSEADRALRTPRVRMNGADRKALWQRYQVGFILLVAVYLALTIIRDVRDNFAVEIWSQLGYDGQPAILTTAELPVAALTLIGLGGLMFIKNNFKALQVNHILTIGGAALLAFSTFLFETQHLSPLWWMVISGFALFLPYIVFNGIFFDRLLAAFRERGNVGFLMYMADAVGYLGSVMVLLWRNFGFAEVSWLHFYTSLCYFGAALCAVLMLLSWFYFAKKKSEYGGEI